MLLHTNNFVVKGSEKSSLNQDSNPGPLAYHLSTLTTELLSPNVLTDIYTSVSLVSQALGKSKLSKQIKNIT